MHNLLLKRKRLRLYALQAQHCMHEMQQEPTGVSNLPQQNRGLRPNLQKLMIIYVGNILLNLIAYNYLNYERWKRDEKFTFKIYEIIITNKFVILL